MNSQDLRQMFSEPQVLLKELHVQHQKLAETEEDATERLAAEIRQTEEKISALRRRRTEVQQIESSLLILAQTLSELANKASEDCERKEVALKVAKESEDFYQGTSTTLSVQERIANDEIADGRKMAAVIMQAIEADTPKRLITDAVEKRKTGEKSKHQPITVGIKMMGAIDERPWSAAFKGMYANSEDWGVKMMSELSIWESIVRNPGFCPFTTVQTGEDKWERRIDDHNEKLSFLKKNFGEEVYNSVTTALMEIELYNGSGRYPIPLPWVFEESRMATLKEVIAHLGSIIEAFVDGFEPSFAQGSAKGTAPPANKTKPPAEGTTPWAKRTRRPAKETAPSAKKSRAHARPRKESKSNKINLD